jgi:acetyl-CoA synthetase (ADP-forming)
MFGAGGVFVEVFRDITFRICPIDAIDAAEMLDDLRIAPILRGARGRAPASEEAIVSTLLAVGGADGLLTRFQNAFSEIDINPLIVSPSGAIACDARLILSKSPHADASI